MRISVRIDCSTTEARRLLGQPDLLPLYEMAAAVAERWIVQRVCALGPAQAAPGRGARDQRAGAARSAMPLSAR